MRIVKPLSQGDYEDSDMRYESVHHKARYILQAQYILVPFFLSEYA